MIANCLPCVHVNLWSFFDRGHLRSMDDPLCTKPRGQNCLSLFCNTAGSVNTCRVQWHKSGTILDPTAMERWPHRTQVIAIGQVRMLLPRAPFCPAVLHVSTLLLGTLVLDRLNTSGCVVADNHSTIYGHNSLHTAHTTGTYPLDGIRECTVSSAHGFGHPKRT